jgi:hypothetical protein
MLIDFTASCYALVDILVKNGNRIGLFADPATGLQQYLMSCF